MNMAFKIDACFEDRLLLHYQDLSVFRTTTKGTEWVSEASFDPWTTYLGCTREDFVNSTGKLERAQEEHLLLLLLLLLLSWDYSFRYFKTIFIWCGMCKL